MFPSLFHIVHGNQWRRWSCSAVLLVCLSVAGCAGFNRLRGDSFRDNELSDYAGQFRGHNRDTQPFAFSNKARQIERNLGAE